MDLKAYDTLTGSEAGAFIEPHNLEGKKMGLRIKVAGPDSRRYNLLKDEVQRAMYKSIADAANGLDVKDAKETEAEKEARFYAGLTLGWEPVDEHDPVVWDGKPFPFTEDNARKLYVYSPIILNQVKVFVENRRNFMSPGFAASDAQSGHALS